MRVVSTTVIALVLSTASLSGCSQQKTTGIDPVVSEQKPDDGHAHAAHQGPHNGTIIDLGHEHKYHAELVEESSSGKVSIYILDGKLAELPIEATSITINLMVAGEAKTFELSAATPDKASRFESAEEALLESLHEHSAGGKLRVTIDGTPHSGQLEAHSHAP